MIYNLPAWPRQPCRFTAAFMKQAVIHPVQQLQPQLRSRHPSLEIDSNAETQPDVTT